jgi:putative effector of murein hydrolase
MSDVASERVGGTADQTGASTSTPSRPVPRFTLPALVVGFVLVVAAGYAFKWRWTGFNKDDQLWDLLHVVLLPVVLATLPLWYRTRERWVVGWRWVLGGVVVAFVILVVGGYTLGWTWTGFPGNTFWDWLELLALPVVVTFLPLWFETHATMAREWRLILGALLVGFVVVVIGGYRLHWAWTGFEGNTLRDWLSLLIVPFLLPASLAWFAARDKARHNAAEAEAAETTVTA